MLQHLKLEQVRRTREGGPSYLKAMSSGPRGETHHYTIPPDDPMELLENERIVGRSILSGPDGTKIWWDKTKIDQGAIDMRQALTEVFSGYKGKAEIGGAPAISHDDLLQVYPLADQHVGLLPGERDR